MPPVPKSRAVKTVRLDPKLLAKIVTAADDAGVSFDEWMAGAAIAKLTADPREVRSPRRPRPI